MSEVDRSWKEQTNLVHFSGKDPARVVKRWYEKLQKKYIFKQISTS